MPQAAMLCFAAFFTSPANAMLAKEIERQKKMPMLFEVDRKPRIGADRFTASRVDDRTPT